MGRNDKIDAKMGYVCVYGMREGEKDRERERERENATCVQYCVVEITALDESLSHLPPAIIPNGTRALRVILVRDVPLRTGTYRA